MKRILRSKLVLSLAAFIMIAAAVVIPLSGSIAHSFAASRSSHNIAYVNYNDSGFTESGIQSANMFVDSVVGGPSPTSSSTDSVTYNGMTFTPLARKSLSTSTLAPYDTLILFEVCDIATFFSSSQHAAINAYLAAGNKILLYDADRCAPSTAGNGAVGSADYSWFTFPFATSNPGPQGASGTLTIVEKSTLTQGLAGDPFNNDELGDANTATTSDPHWFAAAKTTNALHVNGYFLAYARNKGLIIYDGADHWFTQGPTKSLTDLFINELNQQYDPDNLPGSVPIATHQKLFVLLQGVTSALTPLQLSNNEHPGFDQPNGILPYLQTNGFSKASFMEYTYPIDLPPNLPPGARKTILENEHIYSCSDTFYHTIDQDVRVLDLELKHYLSQPGRQNTDVYLIGHSLGGVIAVSYLAYLDHTSGLKGTIPGTNGGKIKGVVTIDSPLGGINPGFANVYYDVLSSYYRLIAPGCRSLLFPIKPLISIKQLNKEYTNNVPRGGQDSLYNLLFSVSRSNQDLLQEAQADGTASLTIGNTIDYSYVARACVDPLELHLIGPEFLDTQWVQDQGKNSGIYTRAVFDGTHPCTGITGVGDNHGVALTNSHVEKAIVEFVNGHTPTALIIPPN